MTKNGVFLIYTVAIAIFSTYTKSMSPCLEIGSYLCILRPEIDTFRLRDSGLQEKAEADSSCFDSLLCIVLITNCTACTSATCQNRMFVQLPCGFKVLGHRGESVCISYKIPMCRCNGTYRNTLFCSRHMLKILSLQDTRGTQSSLLMTSLVQGSHFVTDL